MNGSNVHLIRAIAVLGSTVILAIVALSIWGPTDNERVTSTINTLLTVVVLLIPSLLGFKVAAEAKAAAVASIAVSKENAQALEQVGAKTETIQSIATTTKTMVDGQRTAMETKIATLEGLVNRLIQERAVAQVERTHDRDIARIADAVEAVLPPTGSTPAHGTPVASVPPTGSGDQQ